MKISNLLYMGALSTLALVSCTNNDDNSEWYGSEGIVFTTAIQSRVSGNTWNANDEVGIYMMNAGGTIDAATAQNKKYIAQTNGTLTAASGNGIYLPESGSVDFIAYYPYTTSVSGNKIAANVSDQSKPAAIDLIYSNGTKGVAATTSSNISLTFTHKLSKMTINVSKDATIETLNGLTIDMNGISTEGEFNLGNGTLTATAGTNQKDVAMNVNAEGTTATAIILPTAASTDQTAVTLKFNLAGKSYTYTLTDASIFEEGKNVTFNANLSINNGKPVVTVGTATIEDWTEKPGGDINVDFDGEVQPGKETVVLDAPFATGLDGFTIENKILPSELSWIWQHDSKYQYVKASAFKSQSYASESWLISPEIDLTTATTATLTFEHAINKGNVDNVKKDHIVNISKDNGSTWTPLTNLTYPEGTSWNFISAGNIDLSNYVGSKIKIAFQYKSSDSSSATWEIKNVKVIANGEGGGTVTPEPGEEKVFFTETFANGGTEANKAKIGSFTGWDNSNLTFSDESGNADVRSIAHKTESNPSETAKVNNIWFPSGKDSKLTIAGINTANYSKFKLSYEAAANVYNSGSSIDLNVLKVTFNAQNITIPSRVVSKENNEANVFYTIEVEFEATGTESSTLEFSSAAGENNMGLRLYNIKLVGLPK
jgi:hypothetical protein